MKLTTYNQLIGNEIIKIEEDGFTIILHFKDGTFAEIIGSSMGGHVSLCEHKEFENLIGSTIHYG